MVTCRKLLRLLFVLMCGFSLSTCRIAPQNAESDESVKADSMSPVYAKGFRVVWQNGQRFIQIMNPWDDQLVLQEVILQSKDTVSDDQSTIKQLIKLPVEAVVALSATQWAAFEKMDALDRISGITESDFVQSPAMQKRLKQGKTTDVGRHALLKPEVILQLMPELIIYVPEKTGVPAVLSKTGLPLLAWPDYFETDPLGRAEWIKLVGILVQKEEEAFSMFRAIEEAYLNYRKHTLTLDSRPTIFADKAFNEQWYIPGGSSYMARLFKDAGAQYIWADKPSAASIPMDMESIAARALHADFWRIAHAAPEGYNQEILRKEHALYAHFNAFKRNQIIFCNTAKSAYFEKGPFEPHIVLADLIHFLHPALLPDHKPVYHQILQ